MSSLDMNHMIDNSVGAGAGAGLNQYGASVQQFQYLQNQQQRNPNMEPFMFIQNMAPQVEKQRNEINQFIKSQNARLRLFLQEQRKQQFVLLAKMMDSRARVLLSQKDEVIAKATNRTMELQNRLQRLEKDSQTWQRVAQENEAMVYSLNNRLNQLQEQASYHFNNGVDDAESCCECEEKKKEAMGTEENSNGCFPAIVADQRRAGDGEGEERRLFCKRCSFRRSCVLFLPCRHLCSCKDCAVFLDSCPVCKTPKTVSIEALVS